MSDRIKIVLALFFFIAALTFPLVGLAYGWWRWDAQAGFLLLIGIFAAFFSIGILSLWTVRDLSWLTTSLPFLFGSLYTIIPDMPLQVDDAAATAAGALFSYALALRKNAETPKWILVPLLLAALYTLFGGPIPGPVDEIGVDMIALLISWFGARAGERRTVDEDGKG
ncbi:MAG: hypothetical protein H8E28_13770 [Anaerolineae bacterium]|nr:hypothetical protein [Anaerolineae bacterium]